MLAIQVSSFVPINTRGKESDLEHSISEGSEAEAISRFEIARDRLFRPDCWHELGGKLTAVFQLVNEKGEETNTAIKLNEYIKIDIPGPEPMGGEHFDWVYVSKINENFIPAADESVGIQLSLA